MSDQTAELDAIDDVRLVLDELNVALQFTYSRDVVLELLNNRLNVAILHLRHVSESGTEQ